MSAPMSSVDPFSRSPFSAIRHSKLNELVRNASAVFCDIDGCTFDTEYSQMNAFTDLLNAKTGSNYDFHVIAKVMVSKSERKIISEFIENYGLRGDLEDLLQEREKLYLKRLYENKVPMNEDLVQAVSVSKSLGIPTAILSNGRDKIIRPLTEHYKINHLFDHVYTVDSPERQAKPEYSDKVSFLLDVADRFGLDLENLVVFEDSDGTLAKAAKHGIKGVYVVHPLSKNPNYVSNSKITLRFPDVAVPPDIRTTNAPREALSNISLPHNALYLG